MIRKLSVAAATLLGATALASAASAQNFRQLAEQDLTTIHATLRDNHPAAVVGGQASDNFRSWLDAGLADARGRIGQVNSGDSHAYLLRYYARGFHDPNIVVDPSYEELPVWFGTGWPGVATRWDGANYVVSYVKPGVRGAPPLGAVLVSCDERPVAEMVEQRLDGWEGDMTFEADRIRTAPYILWNRNNPFGGGVPANCKFKVGRRDRDFKMTNQIGDLAGMEAAYRATVYTPGPQPLAVETVNGRPWIHVHTLNDSADWRGFFTAVEAVVPAMQAQGGVIDLRGAAGRSYNPTQRGYGLINRIWTPEFAVSRQPAASDFTYRATAGNRQWYADTLGRMQGDAEFAQQNPAAIEETQAIIAAMDEALAAGQTHFTLASRSAAPDTGAPNPVQGQIIVLTDSGCGPNCLYTVDLLSRLPNVRLAGQVTPPDSVFIEQTTMRLPSNYADLSYGHKAWLSRQRPNGQPFTPAEGLAYTGNLADDTAVRAWVATLFQ